MPSLLIDIPVKKPIHPPIWATSTVVRVLLTQAGDGNPRVACVAESRDLRVSRVGVEVPEPHRLLIRLYSPLSWINSRGDLIAMEEVEFAQFTHPTLGDHFPSLGKVQQMLDVEEPSHTWDFVRELGEPIFVVSSMVDSSAGARRGRFQSLDVVLQNLGIPYQTQTFQFPNLPFPVVADGTTIKHIPSEDDMMWLEVTRETKNGLQTTSVVKRLESVARGLEAHVSVEKGNESLHGLRLQPMGDLGQIPIESPID